MEFQRPQRVKSPVIHLMRQESIRAYEQPEILDQTIWEGITLPEI